MDVETALAIERVTERIEALDAFVRRGLDDLRGEFTDLRGEFTDLRGEFTNLRGEYTDLRGEFTDLRGEFTDLRGEFEGFRGELDGLREEIREVRRHAVVLNESTREDIRFVAEAVAALAVKIDSLKR